MENLDGTNGTPEDRENSYIRNFEDRSDSLGKVARNGSRNEHDKIRVGGENRDKTDTTISRECTNVGLSGKIVGQLIDETEEQLAYYRKQVEELEDRLGHLRQIDTIDDK
jgi:hypothetical protein